jgi:hypothetical protein
MSGECSFGESLQTSFGEGLPTPPFGLSLKSGELRVMSGECLFGESLYEPMVTPVNCSTALLLSRVTPDPPTGQLLYCSRG